MARGATALNSREHRNGHTRLLPYIGIFMGGAAFEEVKHEIKFPHLPQIVDSRFLTLARLPLEVLNKLT